MLLRVPRTYLLGISKCHVGSLIELGQETDKICAWKMGQLPTLSIDLMGEEKYLHEETENCEK